MVIDMYIHDTDMRHLIELILSTKLGNQRKLRKNIYLRGTSKLKTNTSTVIVVSLFMKVLTTFGLDRRNKTHIYTYIHSYQN